MPKVILKQLIKYRLFLKTLLKIQKLKTQNKLILICYLISFTNKSFLLSQLFFLEKKNNSWFKFNINSNMRLINNKFCLFRFDTLTELLYFIFLMKSTLIIPYVFLPLKILNGNSNLELPLSIFNLIAKNILINCFNIYFFWKQLMLLLYSFLYSLLKKN